MSTAVLDTDRAIRLRKAETFFLSSVLTIANRRSTAARSTAQVRKPLSELMCEFEISLVNEPLDLTSYFEVGALRCLA